MAAVSAPPLPAPVTRPVAIQPAYAQSGTPVVAVKPVVETLPGDSQVLDRWKDSGTRLGAAE